MPYKDPERKRQWEREHREQRNARRRTQRPGPGSGQATARKLAPYPASDDKSQATWKVILGWAVGVGVVLITALGTKNVTLYGDPAQPPGGKSGT